MKERHISISHQAKKYRETDGIKNGIPDCFFSPIPFVWQNIAWFLTSKTQSTYGKNLT